MYLHTDKLVYIYIDIDVHIHIYIYTFMRYPTTNLITIIKKAFPVTSLDWKFFKPRRQWPVRGFQQLGTRRFK